MSQTAFDLNELKSNFLGHLSDQQKSFNTIKNYRNDLDCFGNYLFQMQGHYKFQEFTDSSVRAYETYINEKYASENSRRRRIQALRLFFDYLVAKEIFIENPIKKIAPAPKILKTPTPPLPLQVEQFFEVLSKEVNSEKLNLKVVMAKRNRLIFRLIYQAGLKVSDIAGLKKTDILPEKDSYRVLIKSHKRDPYSIPLPRGFSKDFEDYLVTLKEIKDITDIGFSQLFFYANAYKILSGSLSPRGVELFFKQYSKKAHLTMTPRSLRQACILHWFYQKIPETTIKEWMGVAPSYSLKMYREYFQKYQGECFYPNLL